MLKMLNLIVLGAFSCVIAATAQADPMQDCQNDNLPLMTRKFACETVLRQLRQQQRDSGVSANGKTKISGTFDGCEYGKKYELDNGYTMVCRSYGYHYAYRPDVIIVDGSKAYIDSEEYSISIE